ncbi:glycosyltransferase family 2 protein [Marinicellulosiphila megalodicopiae]|uniref:glycosyltransferase family 2 protein n=1 Tax=Marinicellulosiphila megalodicopiae TaxID=2724896 RepID=UPI003BB12F70
MKVSIITVCYNSSSTIEDTIKSVVSQDYCDIEYIIIDGGSTDNTGLLIEKYCDFVDVLVSEQDDGLYDAMNKGIKLATGDVVGILNSDDVLANNNVIQNIVDHMGAYGCVYGDIGFYSDDNFNVKKRHYSSKGFSISKFKRGMMPAHPSCYVKRGEYLKAGEYRTDFKIASDFDMLLRLFTLPKFKSIYLEEEIVKMRLGGVSTSGIKSTYLLNKEIIQSCRSNKIKTNWFLLLSKYPSKFLGYIFK